MRPAFPHLVDCRHLDPVLGKNLRRAACGEQAKTQFQQFAPDLYRRVLVAVPHADERLARLGQLHPGGKLRLDEGLAEGLAHAHDLAGGFHLRPENGIDAGEFDEREYRLLHREIGRNHFLDRAVFDQTLCFQRHPGHAAGRDLGQSEAGRLGHERHGAGGARIDFEHEHRAILDGELHVHQADHFQRHGHLHRLRSQLLLQFGGKRERRQRTGRIARVHARLLDVLHDAADQHMPAVADGVHVHFDGIVEEAVEQHRRVVGDLHRLAHVALEVALLVHDFHGAAAEHVARPHHQRIADFCGKPQCVGLVARGPVGRLPQAQIVQQFLEAFAVLGHVDHVRAGADDGHAVRLQVARELQRRLPAVLHHHAVGLLLVHDLEHVLQRERLEVEAVGSVVIGRNGLRVAVDHNGLETVLAQRERGVNAAVIELDPLADAVGATPQHHDLLAPGRVRFALFLVGGVQVGGIGCEFRGAGIHALVHRPHLERMAALAHLALGRGKQGGEAPVGKAVALEGEQRPHVEVFQALPFQFPFLPHQVLDLRQKPGIDVRIALDLLEREAAAEGVGHVPDALRTGVAELGFEHLRIGGLLVQTVGSGL